MESIGERSNFGFLLGCKIMWWIELENIGSEVKIMFCLVLCLL